MIEYCERCRIEIEKGNGDADVPETCRYCGADLNLATRDEKNREPGEPTKLFLDLTAQPLKRLLRSWKDLDTAALVLFPFVIVFVLVKKIFGSPFLGPVLLDAKPKFRIAGTEDFRRSNPKSIEKASAFFGKLGFVHCLDLACLHYSQPVIKRIYASRDHKRYGSVCVSMAAGKVQFATLETFTAGGKCICVVNRELLPIQMPGNIVLQFFHGASPERLSEEFEKLVERNAEPLVSLPLADYLRFLRKIEAFIIEQGVRQGVFVPGKNDECGPAHTVSMCVNHPASMAASSCSECGASLCESCYTWRNDAVYCDRCLARFENETPTALPLPIDDNGWKAPLADFSGLSGPALESGYGFAGLGARGLAKLIDLFLIFAFTGIVVFAFHWALKLAAENYATSLSVVFAQLVFAMAFVIYFTALFRRWQGGVGHRILGMRVVDRRGRAPSLVASAVRFGYLLLSCLFLFPALGYLFIAFSKNRRGLHDKMADTWVIARHPGRKALLGWSAIILLAAVSGWISLGFWSGFTGNPSPEIPLEKKWELKLDTPSFLRSDYLWKDSATATVSGKLTAVAMVAGERLWVLEKEGKINDAVIENMLSRRHAGFHVHIGARIRPEDEAALGNLAKYIVRASFSQERMLCIPAEKSPDGSDKVVYTRKDGKTEQTFASIECGSYRSSSPARSSKRSWSISIYGTRKITTRPRKKTRISPNSSATIRTPESRNTIIGNESPRSKKNELWDRRRTAAGKRPFPMFAGLFPTFRKPFSIHRQSLPVPFPIRRPPRGTLEKPVVFSLTENVSGVATYNDSDKPVPLDVVCTTPEGVEVKSLVRINGGNKDWIVGKNPMGTSGKRGGVRVIYYFYDETIPLFLLTIFAKGEKDNLSKAERNTLAKLTRELIKIYKGDSK